MDSACWSAAVWCLLSRCHQPPPLFSPSVHSSASPLFLQHLRDVDEAKKYPNKQENKLRDHPGTRAPVFKDPSEKQSHGVMWLRFLRSGTCSQLLFTGR